MSNAPDWSHDRPTLDAADLPDTATIEAYETEDSIVLYDSRSPLGWIESTVAFSLDDST